MVVSENEILKHLRSQVTYKALLLRSCQQLSCHAEYTP